MVTEETLRALLQKLRRMVDFDVDSIYDSSGGWEMRPGVDRLT